MRWVGIVHRDLCRRGRVVYGRNEPVEDVFPRLQHTCPYLLVRVRCEFLTARHYVHDSGLHHDELELVDAVGLKPLLRQRERGISPPAEAPAVGDLERAEWTWPSTVGAHGHPQRRRTPDKHEVAAMRRPGVLTRPRKGREAKQLVFEPNGMMTDWITRASAAWATGSQISMRLFMRCFAWMPVAAHVLSPLVGTPGHPRRGPRAARSQ